MTVLFFSSAWRSAQPTQNLQLSFSRWSTSMKARPHELRLQWRRPLRQQSRTHQQSDPAAVRLAQHPPSRGSLLRHAQRRPKSWKPNTSPAMFGTSY